MKIYKGAATLGAVSAMFDFYKCQHRDVHNWTGDGPFINHQTPGTVAKFYNKDGIRWTSRAYESGRATWDPIWSLQPCGAPLIS
ncbi:hypothetical protein ACIHCV_14445 [Streptomyces sp. NPDC051956]|uniref:hypothetical protein n=1 Tax=Streptomyces sp. NPDC051956 TaxID=3365677 RepID=UPI0037D62950